jgi:hypothetical protein
MRTRARGICLGVALAGIAGVLACRQLVGITDSPPMGDAGGFVYGGSAACDTCVASSCGSEATACSESAPCSAVEKCVGPCKGDPACRARCVDRNRVSITDRTLPLFESCVVRSCASPCGFVCGGVGELAPPEAAWACQSCVVGQDCSTVEACLSDPACAELAFCESEALTPDERGACPLLYDGGANASATTTSLLTCASECEINSNWSCVGHVMWPAGTSGDLTILVSLTDPLSGKQPAGVTAKVCGSDDFPCAHPSATATTTDGGTASLVQHAGAVLAGGYIDLSGGGIVPTVVFWSYPLSQSPASLAVFTLIESEVSDVETAYNVTEGPHNGYVLVTGLDCLQNLGAGLEYKLEPAGPSQELLYEQPGGIFSRTVTKTTTTGAATFFNAPAGPLTLTATVADGGPTVGQFPLFVREGGLTEVTALPQP